MRGAAWGGRPKGKKLILVHMASCAGPILRGTRGPWEETDVGTKAGVHGRRPHLVMRGGPCIGFTWQRRNSFLDGDEPGDLLLEVVASGKYSFEQCRRLASTIHTKMPDATEKCPTLKWLATAPRDMENALHNKMKQAYRIEPYPLKAPGKFQGWVKEITIYIIPAYEMFGLRYHTGWDHFKHVFLGDGGP